MDKLCAAFERKLDRKVHCVTEVDPGLVGGFTLIVDDDYMLDASVRHQLESIRRQFVKTNSRIV